MIMNINTLNIKNQEGKLQTYVFTVELEEEDDGRWSAIIPSLPGCNAWGHTRQEALDAVRQSAQAYLEVLVEDGDPLPKEAEVIASPAVAVTL